MGIPTRQLSEEGVELHLATNYLGHFFLTNLLRPILSPASRVINITSGGYILTPFRFSNPNFTSNTNLPPEEQPNAEIAKAMGLPYLQMGDGKAYVPLLAYCHSNTASMLFTAHLARNGIKAYSAAPGVVETRLQRHMPEGFRNPVMVYKTPSQGAATFLVAAFDPSLNSKCSNTLSTGQKKS
jgi:NAD(P)-dependent dehydrogenase (short-subunit alcohol dehydrogenase family)